MKGMGLISCECGCQGSYHPRLTIKTNGATYYAPHQPVNTEKLHGNLAVAGMYLKNGWKPLKNIGGTKA